MFFGNVYCSNIRQLKLHQANRRGPLNSNDLMTRVVYSKRYNIGFYGIERLHPFDSRKYGRAWKLIQRHFGRAIKEFHIRVKRPVSRDELLLVHSDSYLKRLNRVKYLASALELPIVARLPAFAVDWHVLRPMRWATMGTIVASENALQCGLAINMSGGYHHAKPNAGEGFCIYSDVAIAVASLRKNGLLKSSDRVVYVDTDVHQGNGICHVFLNDPRVFIFDIFNSGIYPAYDVEARNRIDCPVAITSVCTDNEYMQALKNALPGFLDSVSNSRIGIAFYNAGTDIVAGDPLGSLNLSAATVNSRDQFVVSELRKRNIPTVMVLSGGYTKKSYQLISDSVIQLIEKGDTFKASGQRN